MTSRQIKEILTENGVGLVVHRKSLAEKLGISEQTLKRKKLPYISRCTYTIETVVAWLFSNQHYLTKLCTKTNTDYDNSKQN